MSLARYRAKCLEWEEMYGKPEKGPFQWNPAETKAACVKCGKVKKKMSRHHICSDFMFALYRPDLYARRYLEFRKEDIAKMCSRCHQAVERYYEPIKQKMWIEYSASTCTEKWCEKWRAKFREAFEVFMKPRKRKKR